MIRKAFILFLIYFGLCPLANGQYFVSGQDPSSIKWLQINTENFQVIFPQEFEKEAQRLSYVLEKVYAYGSMTLHHEPRKISVILHTHTINSNGLVAWAPKRIELFTTPNQSIYAEDWLEQLAIHEFRHNVQLDKIQNELPGIINVLLGEQATAIVVGLYLPMWFLEGDAVVTETGLSESGRGRMASFSMGYRAQLLEKGAYSYDKAYFGSYKDYVPNYYELGYWMVGKNREKYGSKIWSESLSNIADKPLSFTPFSASLKKNTGQSVKQLYSGMIDEMQYQWTNDFRSRLIDSI